MGSNGKYDWTFKRFALDTVLREYASFFRLAKYMGDTRTVVLLTMCAMIDIAKSRSDAAGISSDKPDTDSAEVAPTGPWDLDMLSREDKRYFSHANWPCNNSALNADQCYRRMLMVLYDAPFI